MTDEPPDDQAARLARNRHYNPDLDPDGAYEPLGRAFGTMAVIEALMLAVLAGLAAARLATLMPWPLAVLAAIACALAIGTIWFMG